MSSVLLFLTVALPLLAAAAMVAWPGGRERLLRLAPLVLAPGLLTAVAAETGATLSLPWLLLDTGLEVDETGQIFLLFSSVLLIIAAAYARFYMADDEARHRFFVFYYLVAAGNYGLLLADDAISFYTSFALMTFSAYGLVVHTGSDFAYRAGRVYIALAVIGEFMLLTGLLIAVHAAGSIDLALVPAALAEDPRGDIAIALFLAGFGVKAGALPLHVWLPLAHPVAPTPASAILSGALIKAGIFGWLRFLPIGEAQLETWGIVWMALGLTAAFYGVAMGVSQTAPKINLAYSSISQMGIVTCGIGVALANPAVAPAVMVAAPAFCLHHGLAKGSLFLAVGVREALPDTRWAGRLVAPGLWLAAATMAGVLLTNGFWAKEALKQLPEPGLTPGYEAVSLLLLLTQTGTTLLMLRLLDLIRRGAGEAGAEHNAMPLWRLWTASVACMAAGLWFAEARYGLGVLHEPSLTVLWNGTWPLLLGLALYLAVSRLGALVPAWARQPVPAGDALVVAETFASRLRIGLATWALPASTRYVARLRRPDVTALLERANIAGMERRLASWRTAGIFLLLTMAALTLLMSQ